MTVIIGLKHKGKLYLAGDRCISDEAESYTYANPKIHRIGDLLIGIAGNPALINMVAYRLNFPEQLSGQTDAAYIHTTVIDSIKKCLCDQDLLRERHIEDEGIHPSIHSNLIIGYRGKFYIVEDDLTVNTQAGNYCAIGSGATYAKGVIEALKDTKTISAEQLLKKSILITSKLTFTVKPPIDIISI